MNKLMPLLDYTANLFEKINLNNVLLIASQHIIETTRQMFDMFIEKGINPKNVFLIGKCYSTNDKVKERFSKMGIYVSPDSSSFDSYLSFDEQGAFC